MALGTLWTIPTQSAGKTIRAAAAYADIKIDLPKGYTHHQDNLKPDFLSKFPLGKIPAWEGKDGFLLFEGTAVAGYISSLAPNSTLLGASPKDSALVDQWLSFASTEIAQNTSAVVSICSGRAPYNKVVHATAIENQTRALKVLEGHLSTRTFLVTERLTVADFAMASALSNAVYVIINAQLRKQLPNVIRFLETVVHHPKVKDIYGEIPYSETGMQYTPPKKEEKEKPKKEEKKPEKKSEKKAKKEEDDDDDDDDEKPADEPKAKNPLDTLPPTTFKLDEWKRTYSNNETRGPGGAIEWFYKNFDKEGYSIWRCDYKYNSELTQVFMSSNLLGGFENRLEASRKYLFGSMGVLGKSNDSAIAGVFILRGKDYKPVMEVAPDWESYDFKPINLDSELDKNFFEAALAWDLELDGKKWDVGRAFK